MNNLTIEVHFSSHFPQYFNNISCSSCIDQNCLKANSSECFVQRMRVSVKYQRQLLQYNNIAFGFCQYSQLKWITEDFFGIFGRA